MKTGLLGQVQRLIIWLGVLPLILTLAAYRTSSAHVESVQETLATGEFLRKLDELLSSVQDAETGQRGYLLTEQELYLQPFAEAAVSIPPLLSEVEVLGRRHGVPIATLRDLRAKVMAKLAELQMTVDLVRTHHRDAAIARVATNEGQREMAEIRRLIGSIKDKQSDVFGERLERQRRGQLELEIVLGCGIVAAFVLLFFAYRFNVLYARERDQVEREIRTLNNSLETRVRERTNQLETRTRELESRSAELQRSNADLMQFAYVASHDLQEPLRMVGSYMGLLARRYGGQLDETADRYIAFAVDGANRMQALINDLLLYSRTGTQPLDKRAVAMEQVLRNVLENLRLAINETSAVVRYENLPVVEADEMKITQVLQNLVSNALKFRRDGINPEISLTARQMEGYWQFAVADNGIGFEPKYCDRIFQIFQRLHGVGKYPGNGIGLAICRRIIEHHGGQLWAESEPGVGSTFFFTLPTATDRPFGQSDFGREHSRNMTEPAIHG